MSGCFFMGNIVDVYFVCGILLLGMIKELNIH